MQFDGNAPGSTSCLVGIRDDWYSVFELLVELASSLLYGIGDCEKSLLLARIGGRGSQLTSAEDLALNRCKRGNIIAHGIAAFPQALKSVGQYGRLIGSELVLGARNRERRSISKKPFSDFTCGHGCNDPLKALSALFSQQLN